MPERRAPAFRPLLSYEVNSLSDALRRGAALRFKREHGASLMEWRVLALIDFLQPTRLRDLVAYSSTDKAQISRIVSGLVARGLVARRADAADARSARLGLSDTGKNMLLGLVHSAQSRDRTLRACLSPLELEQLISSIAKLRAKALDLAEDEERLSSRRR